MFVKFRFNLFSMLFLLFLFTGCNSKISVDLLSKLKSSKNGETSSSRNLGSVYAEFDPSTNRFIEKKVVARAGMDINSHVYFSIKQIANQSAGDEQFFIDKGIVLDKNKKYSVFKYYKNSYINYRISEFMEYDKIIFDLEWELVPN